MKTQRGNFCIRWIVISEVVGFLAGVLSMDGMDLYNSTAVKPPLAPPGWVFPVVWTILYALMGLGVCLAISTENTIDKQRSINLFIVQLIVNFFWPLFFFRAEVYGFSLAWLALLWFLVLLMIISFSKTSVTAAWLQVPYLVWLTFAAYLNAAVWIINS